VDVDNSVYVNEVTKRINECITRGQNLADIDVTQIENDIIRSATIVPRNVHKNAKREGRKISRARRRTGRQVRGEIAKYWKSPAGQLEKFLAIANLVNARLVYAVFTNGEILRSKDPRPVSDKVTGAYLKCLHLLALYGKSCRIATEISHLLRAGFPDAAASRFRTLHEHLVVMMLLHNDRTYELSEDYQDSAMFEYLKQLKADRSSLSDPFWLVNGATLEELSRDIGTAELAADEIISRRGSKIKNQYEWARPALSDEKKNNLKRRIQFIDLEEAAGADFLRTFYMLGNDRIHAGAYAAINHFDFDSSKLSATRQRRDDWTIYLVGAGVPTLMAWAARAAGKSIAWETEEYDELLYVCELQREADATVRAFADTHLGLSPSS
jgi:Family of unknown function (DUF5677)